MNAAAGRLREAGIDEPRRDAEEILAHSIQSSRSYLIAHPERILTPSECDRFDRFVRRRESREPLQYILGYVHFMDLTLRCDSRALIPRPETELLVETAIELIEGVESPLIADICAGSGCIAIALARAIPSARIFAIDISEEALELAMENARDLAVADRIEFACNDLVEPLVKAEVECDLVCSNPPYVSAEEFETLPNEIRCHEPARALLADEDGMAFYRRLINESCRILKSGGYLLMEMPDEKSNRILDMLDIRADSGDDIINGCRSRFTVEKIIRDCAGVDRTLALKFETI